MGSLDQVSFLLERPAKSCKSDPNITKVAKGVTQLNLTLQKSDPIKLKVAKSDPIKIKSCKITLARVSLSISSFSLGAFGENVTNSLRPKK